MKYFDHISTPLGEMLLIEENNAITHLSLPAKESLPEDFLKTSAIEQCTPVILSAKAQLTEYFQGNRREFDLPLNPSGTPFQKKVWKALCTIPYGETRSYKDIAVQIENPKGCRAVGMANNKNTIMIIIPCHRVIGSNGSLVGYGGGLHIKEWLLAHERKYSL
ncbi:MAG: methylated-DNA--[protein]-cysteine S-methyltransferase [Lachnospiraceae bacterium]|nr:methylated-DNA--[protein]-cysteine S-methyltransferase [Lachnospiraceae bacterium]